MLRAGATSTRCGARTAAAEAAWRASELRKLEGHTSVPAALRRALLRRAIGRRAHDAYLARLRRARGPRRASRRARRARSAPCWARSSGSPRPAS